jgi:hypothetical protein
MRRLHFDLGKARENFSSSVELVRSSGLLPDFEAHIQDFSQFYPRAHRAHEEGAVLGKILGAKGEILIYSSEGQNFAVNMRKKVGTFFERKESEY